MKTLLIAFLFILLVIGCGKKSTNPEPGEVTPPPTTSCVVSPTRLKFGYSVRSDSFVVKNTGGTILTGSLRVRNEIPQGWRYFYIDSPLSYILDPGDSVVIKIYYVDFWNNQTLPYIEEGIIETGHWACSDVYCTGKY